MRGFRRTAALCGVVLGSVLALAPAVSATVENVTGKAHLTTPDTDIPLTGRFSDDGGAPTLAFDEVTVSYTFLDALPVTARLQFATAGPVEAGDASLTVPMTVTVADFAVLGTHVGGGTDCRTAEPFTVALAATGPTYHAEFDLPALTGCGQFNDNLTTMFSGDGNTVDLTIGG
ncbi:hypothetical protein [Actinomadura atramentaria]|uniref:hypothetical protein n=1 Tax=Actinomadura atramentaria TaxID=1990 RepID=UPI0003689F0D|nr:hypothetical protein [Actinomadura atramentaria]